MERGLLSGAGLLFVCVAFGFICFVLFLFFSFLFFSFFFFSLGIKGGLKLFLAVVQWVGSFGGLSRQLCPYNLTHGKEGAKNSTKNGKNNLPNLFFFDAKKFLEKSEGFLKRFVWFNNFRKLSVQ